MTTLTPLPHWDMTVVYPNLESAEFADGFLHVQAEIGSLSKLFDAEEIGQHPPAPMDPATVARFERVIEQLNTVLTETQTLSRYIAAFRNTDSRNATAQARWSELEQHLVVLSQLSTRFTAWIGSLDVEALIAQSPAAADHAFALRQARQRAAHLMSPAEEALAAELNVTGGAAWEKLSETLTSQITVSLELDGSQQALPMSMVHNLAYAAERDRRRRGYEAELAAWQQVAPTLAETMNSIKGQVIALTRRRGWESPLDETLFQTRIDRQTLDAMMAAARDAFPDFRRYLRTKARALGLERLAWYDLFAPVGGGERAWNFDEATAFIIEQFGAYSPKMRDYAARAFREHWIDAEPRAGKEGGGFCMWLRDDESRILVNFTPSYNAMSTLAHELGHGYHNLNLAPRTPLQRSTPMTLAETASIFCETLVKQAALQNASPAEQLEIIEASLQGSCQVVVDITSRFLFEQRVFEQRQQRALAPEELSEIMLETQRETYGDGLDASALHPYMWAAKPHYYSSDRSFYNFPYMFGLLFGLGCYARYEENPEAFRQNYDDLL
ncbi:MAG TPA: M3 family oligoendopeptidase, partial [Ktedonobacterales bacterium]|nr:M3 family oligoendopeptidase [Ktedonobacterales bacterium]